MRKNIIFILSLTLFTFLGSWDKKVRIFDQKEYKCEKTYNNIDYAVVSISADDDGDFLFVGEKNGSVKIWGKDEKGEDKIKQKIEVGTGLNAISFQSKWYAVITLATQKGLVIKNIKGSADIYKCQPEPFVSCTSLAWDESRTLLFAGFSDGVIRVFQIASA